MCAKEKVEFSVVVECEPHMVIVGSGNVRETVPHDRRKQHSEGQSCL